MVLDREDGMKTTEADEIASLRSKLDKANARIERLLTLVRKRDDVIREIRKACNSVSTQRV